MRKIIAKLDLDWAGCEAYEPLVFDDDYPEGMIDDVVFAEAVRHAEMYTTVYSPQEFDDLSEEEYAEIEKEGNYLTTEQVYYEWEDYVPEKHDDLRAGGGSFQEDFDALMED